MTDNTQNLKQIKTVKSISIGDWLNKGWDIIASDLSNFVILTLIYMVFAIALSATVIGEFLITGPLTAGYFLIIFNKIRGKSIYIGDIAKGFNFFIAAVLADILISVFVTVGFIFLIIPGIIIFALYMFTYPNIVEKNMDFWTAMEESRILVTKHLFEFSIFALILIMIFLVGFLLFGVGLLIAVPLIFAAIACAYDDMVGLQKE